MSELRNIPVEDVVPNPEQPRVEFDAVEIASLAESIREQGLIQPITVEEYGDGYLLIDGERRLRAMKSLGKPLIEAKVILFGEEKSSDRLSQAVVANLQRADLNPIEEARAFMEMREHGMTLAMISKLVGRSITHISFRIKLLEFETEVQELFAARKLPIDPQWIYSALELPSEVRVKMLRNFAANGTSCGVIKRAVTKYLNRAELPDVPLTGRKHAPAVIMSDMPADSRMMNLAGKDGALPEWEMLERAAVETCEHCDLNDIASAQMCKDCPAVELLKRLKRIAGEE